MICKTHTIEDDHFHDHCGVFGIFGHAEAAKMTYLGLYALQHRGQESAGIASSDGAQLHVHKAMGHVQEIFTPAVITKLPGESAIGHTRYSTAGDTTLTNAQPVVIDCNKGKLALGHNGNLTNAIELRKKLEHRGSIFQTTSDTEVIVHLIARSTARNLSGAIADALNQVEGAYSLLLLTPDEIFAIRDPRGFRPLSIGRLNGAWVAASETCAFDLIDAEYVREVEPGEMVRISRGGIESIRFAPQKQNQFCIFEHVYFSRPDSVVFGKPVNETRERLGRLLAQEHPVDADIVVPVPDSGVPAAVGYAAESGIPFPHGIDTQSLHRPHVHRAEPGDSRFRGEAETESNTSNDRRKTSHSGGRFDRARHHQPQDCTAGSRSRRHRSARAHQLPANDFALLLRRGYASA
jgi:amidophosphoribosyltransferase